MITNNMTKITARAYGLQKENQEKNKYGNVMKFPSEYVGRFIGKNGRNIRRFKDKFPNNVIYIHQDNNGDFLMCEKKNRRAIHYSIIFKEALNQLKYFGYYSRNPASIQKSSVKPVIIDAPDIDNLDNFPILSDSSGSSISSDTSSQTSWSEIIKTQAKSKNAVGKKSQFLKNIEDMEYLENSLSENEKKQVFEDVYILTPEEEQDYFDTWDNIPSDECNPKGFYIDEDYFVHYNRAINQEGGWYFNCRGEWEWHLSQHF